jgi:hypothetical protein
MAYGEDVPGMSFDMSSQSRATAVARSGGSESSDSDSDDSDDSSDELKKRDSVKQAPGQPAFNGVVWYVVRGACRVVCIPLKLYQ